MNTSHNPSSVTRHPASRGTGLRAATVAGHYQDLVIVDFAELASAGVPGVCGACIADYAAREPATATIA